MTGDGVDAEVVRGKARRRARSRPEEESDQPAAIRCSRAGDWLPAEELQAAALDAVHSATDITLDLAEVDHLDAGTLQILLALADNRREKGLSLHLVNASPLLSQWFQYAGAPQHLSPKTAGQP